MEMVISPIMMKLQELNTKLMKMLLRLIMLKRPIAKKKRKLWISLKRNMRSLKNCFKFIWITILNGKKLRNSF
jgi:hypothetical protein